MPRYRYRPDGLAEVETSAGPLPLPASDEDLRSHGYEHGLSFESYDDKGRAEEPKPTGDKSLSFESYDDKGRTGAPDLVSSAPKTSRLGTVARRAAITGAEALMAPVKAGAGLLRNAVDTEAIRKLSAEDTLDEAEGYVRGESPAQARLRRLAGERKYPTETGLGDIAGELGAGAIQGGAVKAGAPAVRRVGKDLAEGFSGSRASQRGVAQPGARARARPDPVGRWFTAERRNYAGIDNLDDAHSLRRAMSYAESFEAPAAVRHRLNNRLVVADWFETHKNDIGVSNLNNVDNLEDALEWAKANGAPADVRDQLSNRFAAALEEVRERRRARPAPPAPPPLPTPPNPIGDNFDGSRKSVKALLGNPDKHGYDVQLDSQKSTPHKLEVKAKLLDATGKPAGRLERTYYRDSAGDLHVKHDYFKLFDEANQGKGFGSKVLRDQFEQYDKHGVSTVRTDAHWEGRYVWPSRGFDLANPAEFDGMKRSWRDWAARQGVDPGDFDPKNITELAHWEPSGAPLSDVVDSRTDAEIPVSGKAFLLRDQQPPLDLVVDLNGESGSRLRDYYRLPEREHVPKPRKVAGSVYPPPEPDDY